MTPTELVLYNQDLVYMVANRMRVANNEDLVQEGYLGLCYAAMRFDETRKVKFSAYAVPYIKGYIIRGIHKSKVIPDQRREKGWYPPAECSSLDEVVINGSDVVSRFESIPSPQNVEAEALQGVAWSRVSKKLTEEQIKIWEMKLEGMANTKIAQELGKSALYVDRTVRTVALKLAKELEYGD